ncbi:hypothetical protein SUDANB6_02917 [Streptomyces sp. enrichment culture]|uniref:GAF and ANTAR domain-containing protein n=1 Tax=Streptomyces sp. enrichment culture TaxID=1795815 RepID=UPI003F556CB5
MPKRFVVTASEFGDLPRFLEGSAGVELAEALTAVARQLHETTTPHSTLHTAVRLAVRFVPGAERAGISVVERGSRPHSGRRRALAWTDEVVRSAESRNGGREPFPHWERLWTAPVARMEDSEADGDTGGLSALGLRSALSLRLRADRRSLTVLTAYAGRPRVFDENAVRIGRLFTAHVGIALDAATVRAQLTEAMRTRDLIGQATGILMERQNIDAASAFESLVKASQRENVKLRDLSRRIVDAHDTSAGRGVNER